MQSLLLFLLLWAHKSLIVSAAEFPDLPYSCFLSQALIQLDSLNKILLRNGSNVARFAAHVGEARYRQIVAYQLYNNDCSASASRSGGGPRRPGDFRKLKNSSTSPRRNQIRELWLRDSCRSSLKHCITLAGTSLTFFLSLLATIFRRYI